MKHRSPVDPDPPRLSELAAARLLARASELDAARGAGTAISDLRAAATEAGISMRAFDAALAEMQGGIPAAAIVAPVPRRRRMGISSLIASIAVVLLIASLSISRVQVREAGAAVPGGPVVDEAILLRCLAPEDAAELIRPLLTLPSNMIRMRQSPSARVLTIRATPAQIAEVRAALEAYEGSASGACAALPTSTPAPR